MAVVSESHDHEAGIRGTLFFFNFRLKLTLNMCHRSPVYAYLQELIPVPISILGQNERASPQCDAER